MVEEERDAQVQLDIYTIDSPCECEHNNPDSLDTRLFPSVVLAVAPAVTMDEASSLPWYLRPILPLPFNRVGLRARAIQISAATEVSKLSTTAIHVYCLCAVCMCFLSERREGSVESV